IVHLPLFFSREVRDLIKAALEKAEDCTEAAQQELKDSLKKASDTIDKRQKLIRLADSSSYGWATVSEYEAHQLAEDDENDDNKITRAENRAGRKIKQKKAAAATQQQPKKFKWGNSQNVETTGNSSFRRPSQFSAPYTSFSRGKGGGACFLCGSFAHWKATCPRRYSFNKPATTTTGQ
ncbi:uncharacterized protein LOC117293524, partial [Asterias rubens]|uniref:uncharacterized protein LOC117293524 n=1 Tax=Asterias rubens TaxID=7604 RepID=UPI00145542CD